MANHLCFSLVSEDPYECPCLPMTSLTPFPPSDLERKALVFPAVTQTTHVVLKNTVQRPLTSFTLCMRFYSDLTRPYSLFSYATKRNDNEILLCMEKPRQYSFHVGNQYVLFNVPEKFSTNAGGEHVCVSWESSTGLVEFWMNGQPLVRKSLKKGYSVSPEASIILGQEQDSYGGTFEINQSFSGEISDLFMWDRVLSPNEVNLAWYNVPLPSYLINWKSLSYKIQGDVFVKPALSSFYRVAVKHAPHPVKHAPTP